MGNNSKVSFGEVYRQTNGVKFSCRSQTCKYKEGGDWTKRWLDN